MRKSPGSYYPRPREAQNEHAHSRYPEGHSLDPQSRVVRNFDIESAGVFEWNDYVNSLGRENEGNARVRIPGNLQYTYIDSTQMGRMFKHRFNSTSPEKLLREMRTVSRYYNDYVFESGDRTLEKKLELDEENQEACMNWLGGEFEIDDMLVPPDNSKTRRAFIFSSISRTILRSELSDTVAWFKNEGFDTRNLGRGKPHLTIAETFHPIGSVAFSKSKLPTPIYVPLEQPSMIVFPNYPSKQ